jgi:hypothetical protein
MKATWAVRIAGIIVVIALTALVAREPRTPSKDGLFFAVIFFIIAARRKPKSSLQIRGRFVPLCDFQTSNRTSFGTLEPLKRGLLRPYSKSAA